MNEGRRSRAREVIGDGGIARGTRERLIDVSIQLFYLHGVHATGLDVILAEVGTTKTTFYKYFESKDQLVYEALQRRDSWELEWFHRAIRSAEKDDPIATLLAVFDVLNEWFTDPRFKGFQFINAATQFPRQGDPIFKLAQKHLIALQALLQETAERLGAAYPDKLSQQLLLLVEGSISVRLILGNDSSARLGRELAELVATRSIVN